ncbi:hypothetical protein I5M32_01195 [Pedobacter sp. SD-b]|uniref:Calx-beta domain-containing protein n=1 Tax=Pedobacter segetis TaxID=2793069 RepID=A0ABS1BFB0_9SPHI|nr:hypothetical protein [Pedobacter segetis]MBK0381562.1 hypothetical protein [Pedobacter segetis]
MKKFIKLFAFVFVCAFITTTFSGCSNKDNYPVTNPPLQASFTGLSTANFGVSNTVPVPTYKLPIGLTTTSNSDTKITVSVTSPTGAVEGTQYKIASKTLTLPAGSVLGYLDITSSYDAYKNDRVDTLVIKITSADGVTPSDYNNTIKLVINKFCPFNADLLSGDFTVITDEWADYAPGSTITVTKVDAGTVSFKYGANNAKPILIKVNSKNVTSVTKQEYGDYGSANGGPFSVQSVNSSKNVAAPCEGTISVLLNHTNSRGDYGNYLIVLKKK